MSAGTHSEPPAFLHVDTRSRNLLTRPIVTAQWLLHNVITFRLPAPADGPTRTEPLGVVPPKVVVCPSCVYDRLALIDMGEAVTTKAVEC